MKLGTLAFWVFQTSAGFEQYTKEGKKSHTTLEAAKAAAQADYERRIIAALLPTEAGAMRCAECDCENGGADCTWIATPPAAPTDTALVEVLTTMLNKLRSEASRGALSTREIFALTDPMADALSRAALRALAGGEA